MVPSPAPTATSPATGVTVSQAKWLSLVPIIGGVSLASLKEVSFSWLACGATLTHGPGRKHPKVSRLPEMRLG